VTVYLYIPTVWSCLDCLPASVIRPQLCQYLIAIDSDTSRSPSVGLVAEQPTSG